MPRPSQARVARSVGETSTSIPARDAALKQLTSRRGAGAARRRPPVPRDAGATGGAVDRRPGQRSSPGRMAGARIPYACAVTPRCLCRPDVRRAQSLTVRPARSPQAELAEPTRFLPTYHQRPTKVLSRPEPVTGPSFARNGKPHRIQIRATVRCGRRLAGVHDAEMPPDRCFHLERYRQASTTPTPDFCKWLRQLQ